MCPIESNGGINGILGFNLHFYTKVELNVGIKLKVFSSSSRYVRSYVQGQQNKDWFKWIGSLLRSLSVEVNNALY